MRGNDHVSQQHHGKSSRMITPRVVVSLMFVAALTFPVEAKKKPKPATPPTQPDVLNDCIAIRNIVFHAPGFGNLFNARVSGQVENRCGHEVHVLFSAHFFSANGDRIYTGYLDKLVPPHATLPFGAGPEQNSREASTARQARIADVLIVQ